MPMEANAASAAGSLQPIQRPTNANQTDSPRRIESAVESPFAKETNVTIRNSVADLSAVLERISSAQEDAVEAMPQDLQKVLRNIMRTAFAMDETLAQGVGSAAESWRFSTEQLTNFAKTLASLGLMSEKGVFDADFTEGIQTLLQDLKAMVTDASAGRDVFEPALLHKLAFDFLSKGEATPLPQELVDFLKELPQPIGTTSANSSAQANAALRQLLNIFVPPAVEMSNAETANPAEMMPNGQTSNSTGMQGQVPLSANGQTQVSTQGATSPANATPNTTMGQATANPSATNANVQVNMQNAPSVNANTNPTQGQNASAMLTENAMPANANPNANEQSQNGIMESPARSNAPLASEANGKQSTAQGASMANHAQANNASEAKNTDVNIAKQNSQDTMNPIPAWGVTTQGLRFPLPENADTMGKALRDVATFLLRNPEMPEAEQTALQNFLDKSAGKLPERDLQSLNLLLRLSQGSIPASVRQAATQGNLTDLPRLWAFLNFIDLTAVKGMRAHQLRRAARDIAEFAASMRHSMGGSAFRSADATGNQRSLSFMLPLYLDNGQKEPFPAYLHVYDENKKTAEDGRQHKETWLRLCVLTDHVGAVEMVFQVRDDKAVRLRILFSDPDTLHDFRTFVPEVRGAFKDTKLRLDDLKIGMAGSK